MSDPSSSSSSSAISANLQWQDPAIRNDLYRIIAQFCEEEGLHATRQAFAEEWTGKVRERDEISGDARKLRKAILDGDWEDVEKLLAKPFVRGNNAFKYAVFKQQMLEHIEQREYQKAFTFLNKRLRELEHFQPFNGEFRDLCYLLSGKSISDAPSFRAWEGVRPARIALVAQFSSILEQERGVEPNESANYIAPHRLKTLLHQAVAFQVKQNSFQKQTAPTISSLLYDYESFVCPNTIKSTMIGHQKNVKSIAWIGQQGHHIASGSSDGTVRIWRTADAQQEVVLPHGSKVWNVAATESGRFLASAGGQALVKLWNLQTNECVANFGSPTLSDVYSCAFDGSESRLLSGGYDKIVRLYDLTSNTLEKTFTGHALGVSCVTFDRTGRLAITASKDCSIRIWDLSSGLCVRTIYGHLGECTSVALSQTGREMLTASKDNSAMLHDLRTLKFVRRYKGAQNTRANFVRASFATNKMIASGSEDAQIYLWDIQSGECIQTLSSGNDAAGTVYCAEYNAAQSLLASCGDDGTIRTWYGCEPSIAAAAA